MPKFVISTKAKSDLRSIFRYIANDNPKAAMKHNDNFLKLFQLLAENPNTGTLHEEYGDKIRVTPTGSYLVFHRFTSHLSIVRVIHGGRNIEKDWIN